jgi:hypothetical protein
MGQHDGADDANLYKSPRLHDVGEPGVEFFVGGDFEKHVVMNEPDFSRIADRSIEAEEFDRSFLTPEGESTAGRLLCDGLCITRG